MSAALSIQDLIIHDGEPTVLDLRLAQLLDFAQARDVRKLISRNIDELQRYGEVCAMVAQTSSRGGRPTTEYHLNEAQALLISMKSETPKAASVREQLIRVFMAWRRGEFETEPAPFGASFTPSMAPAPLGAQVALLNWITRGRGFEVAANYMESIGLPPLPASPGRGRLAIDPADGQECLNYLLSYTVNDDPELRSVAEIFISNDKSARFALEDIGIRLATDGLWLATGKPEMRAIWEATRWRDGQWASLLKRLPGVTTGHERMTIAGYQCRPVWLPATLFRFNT